MLPGEDHLRQRPTLGWQTRERGGGDGADGGAAGSEHGYEKLVVVE